MEIKVLEEDLADGVLLCNLLEVISSEKVPMGSKKPKSKFQKIENLNNALAFIKNAGLKLENIGAEDIHDGKLKLILGLIWTLILRYQINLGEGSPKWELLQWVRQQVKPYAVDEPNNFTKDWMNGKLIYALVDSLQTGIITPKDMSGMSGNALDDTEKAMKTALDTYGIPMILDATDMVNNPEELSMMTYISYYREYLGEESRRKREEHLRKLRTVDAANTFADGPGLTHADTFAPAHFCIHARNCFGNPLEPLHGGDTFVVDINGPEGKVTAKITDSGNGDYPVEYQTKLPGTYTIAVTFEGAHIKASPFSATSVGPSGSHSTVTGPGVEGGIVGQPAAVKVTSFNAEGKRVPHGGDPFTVEVKEGPSAVGPVTLKDNGDGTFDGAYTATKPGYYVVEAKVNGEHLKNSPFKVLHQQGNAAKSYADGPGITNGQAEHDQKFTIHSVAPDGTPVKVGGDPFVVKVTGPSGDVPVTMKDNGDGTYDCDYTPNKPGNYKVDVTLHGAPIKDAPFSLTCKAASSAGNSYAEGEGLTKAEDNAPATFTIHAVDPEGKPRTDGGDAFAVEFKGPADVPFTLEDKNDGTYVCTYEAQEPGTYELNVTCEGKHIKDSPFHPEVKEGTDADNVSGGSFTFTVQAKDKRGNAKTFGGDKFEVNIKGPNDSDSEVTTRDNGDGTYTALYTLEGEGEYKIFVKLNGKSIKSSPLKATV